MSAVKLPATIDATTTAITLAVEDEAAVHGFALAEKSAATRRAYRSDFAVFSAWCTGRGFEPLPAAPTAVAAFLADQAKSGVHPSTLGRRVAAIAYAHDLAGMASPAAAKVVRVVLGGIRREKGVKPVQKAPATAERVTLMLERIPDTRRGRRDRALLALGFAGAFRRSELVALEIADLTFEPDGMRVQIRRSKTDQESQGQEIAVPRGNKLRPVRAVQAWMKAARIKDGPLFRSIDKHGYIGGALTAQSVALIVKAHAEAAGFDPREFSGHSLRSGFLTSAAEAGADVLRMMEVSRHKRVETVQGYVRRANLFKGHAGAGFL
jgi:site-specific recombinase XerD